MSACLAYCDAMRPKPVRRDFLFDLVAHLRVRLDAARVKNGNLVVLGNDFFGDNELGERLDVAVFLVNLHAQFARRADRLLGGGQQSLLNSADQDITVDALFALPKFQDGQKICVHKLKNGGVAVGTRRIKKPERPASPTFARWPNQQTLPLLTHKPNFLPGSVKRKSDMKSGMIGKGGAS